MNCRSTVVAISATVATFLVADAGRVEHRLEGYGWEGGKRWQEARKEIGGVHVLRTSKHQPFHAFLCAE
ncbi:hypothetical protein FA10DRAFT_99556 [Acaromyces ingoldii]|uniref:Secreted protein n=1 Tax=Acaromyces ingoldii TaxID=215250 RepID=A0A316YL00_9BASI|nr:hypothetical protein FA10DRAFT_99556 [Acaromyces ingoldii]PWN89882.1 hypothetical protein FA10DRAFT_99556 [Acaromyces ingoldii]